jgi:hydroxymethylbilane synthase
MAQLRALRPDLEVVPIRGNADTRLRKATTGEVDAVVLAYAGLNRIKRLDDVAEVFEADQMLPAPGQGALAIECRADRADLIELLAVLDDPATRAAVISERTLLAVLEAGCSAPVGAYAALQARQTVHNAHNASSVHTGAEDQNLHLTAAVVAYDGSRQVRLSASGHPSEAERLGRDLATRLLAEGAGQLIGEHAH